MRLRSVLLVAIVMVGASVRLFAGTNYPPENNQVRLALSNIIFAPTSEVLSSSPAIYPNSSQGTPVRFDVMQQDGDYYLLFTNKEGPGFPIDSAGSYIIKRRDRNGDFAQVKVFLRDGPDSFVRMFPMGERTSMTVYLCGYPMYRDVVIPVPFKQILTDSFARVMDLTHASVDWSLIFPNRPLPEDRAVEDFVNTIGARLPRLPVQNDGGVGVAKWIIDGLIAAQSGSISNATWTPNSFPAPGGARSSAPLPSVRNPSYGLDWARRLATAAARIEYPGARLTSSDVTSVPFLRYVPNVGFPVADLRFVLYELAVANPGCFYLGAVSSGHGTNPSTRDYANVVALFPYFDDSGQFVIRVVNGKLQTGVDSLKQRFSDDYIQLEQVIASSDFWPSEAVTESLQ